MVKENWLQAAQHDYDPRRIHEGYGVDAQTRFGPVMYYLENKGKEVLPPADKPNVLIIGPGGNSDVGYMPYELYELTGYLEHCGKDYNLDIIDINKEIIGEVLKRRSMGISLWNLMASRAADLFFEFSWETYCKYIGYSSKLRQNQEVFWAPIPKGLQIKLDNDEVGTTVSDIAQAALPVSKYDLIVCRNVLYQLDEVGFKLAYFQLAQSLKPGGKLWTNYGLIIHRSFVTSNVQEQLAQEEWFLDLALEKGPVLDDADGCPIEFMFIKKEV